MGEATDMRGYRDRLIDGPGILIQRIRISVERGNVRSRRFHAGHLVGEDLLPVPEIAERLLLEEVGGG